MADAKRSTLARVGDRVMGFVNPSVRVPVRHEYTGAEIRAFKDAVAAFGADIGGGRYPNPGSVAYRGPGYPLGDRPWRNGMFLDVPAASAPSQANSTGQRARQQQSQQQRQRPASQPAHDRSRRPQHSYERRLGLSPIRETLPASRQPLRRQQQARVQAQQGWDDDSRQMAIAIANVDWAHDRLFDESPAMTDSEDDRAPIRIGPAPGTAEWDNDPNYPRQGPPVAAAPRQQQQQPLVRRPVAPTHDISYLSMSTYVWSSDSDSDIEYVNSQGVPFPRTPRSARRGRAQRRRN